MTCVSSGSVVQVDLDGAIGTVRLNHPPVNAIDTAMLDQLESALKRLEDSEVRVAILTGGDAMFSGGFDVNQLKVSTPLDAIPRNQRCYAVYQMVEAARFPVIAAINGYVVGGGCELALACDFRVLASDAFFSWPEVNLAGLAHMQRLLRMIGVSEARRLVYTGERCSAEEAHRLGLAEVLAAPGQAVPTALSLAQQIARKPQSVIEACKKATRIGLDVALPIAQQAELTLLGEIAGIKERDESLAAFGQ